DLVLSGVNRGANLAEDVTMSGTVAGAIEAMAMGVRGIALSQMGGYDSSDPYFEAAEAFAPGIIRKLVEVGWPGDVVLNVNFRDPGAAADRRGRGHPPGLPGRSGADGRETHRPSGPRLLLDGLPPGALEACRRHRPARALRRAHLDHAAAHRPDPHAHRARAEG